MRSMNKPTSGWDDAPFTGDSPMDMEDEEDRPPVDEGKQKEIDPQPSESPSRSVSRDRTTESSSNEREGSVLVFMDPIVPEEQPPAVEVSRFIRLN